VTEELAYTDQMNVRGVVEDSRLKKSFGSIHIKRYNKWSQTTLPWFSEARMYHDIDEEGFQISSI
jgi:hypothetical protein